MLQVTRLWYNKYHGPLADVLGHVINDAINDCTTHDDNTNDYN